jgi:beta-glucanase (GH16 family)
LVLCDLGHYGAGIAAEVSDGVLTRAILFLLFAAALGTPQTARVVSGSPPWTLAWSDDFDGPAGAAPDPAKWAFDTGGGGWGNQELETYTDTRDNSYLDGKGNLVIEVRQPAPGQYTSARLKTEGKFAIAYGRIEARIKLPAGQGIWPAFWMLGADMPKAGWPRSGEIDIMENIGREPSMVHGTVHGPDYSGAHGIGQSYSLTGGARFADDYHIFAVEWLPKSIRFLVDDRVYFTVTPQSLPQGASWVFGHPFFLLLNVAVGGSWPGNPDATVTFPQKCW